MELSVSNITAKLQAEPFDPVNSIIIFGIKQKAAVVFELLINVLELNITIKCAERTSSRANQPGAIKVELTDVYEKCRSCEPKAGWVT